MTALCHAPDTTVERGPRRVRRFTTDLLVLGVIAVLAFAMWPARLGGATSYVIVKGTSMQPTFHTGDLVVVRTEDRYRVGDVVAFRVATGAIRGSMIIHRVVAVDGDRYTTRGDNRTTNDSWTTTSRDIVGRERLLIGLPGIQLWTLIPWAFCALIGTAVMWLLWPPSTLRKTSADVGVDLTGSPAESGRSPRARTVRRSQLAAARAEQLTLVRRLAAVLLVIAGLMMVA